MQAAAPPRSGGPAIRGNGQLLWPSLSLVAARIMRLATDLAGIRVVWLGDQLRFAAQAQACKLEAGDGQSECEVGRNVSTDGRYLLQSQRQIHRLHVERDVERLNLKRERLDVQRDRGQMIDADMEVAWNAVESEVEVRGNPAHAAASMTPGPTAGTRDRSSHLVKRASSDRWYPCDSNPPESFG